MTHFVYMNTLKDWFKKKAIFVRSAKVEMISTFKRNRQFRKAFVNKTFTHVQEGKKAMSPRHSAEIPSSVKSPLDLVTINLRSGSTKFWCHDSAIECKQNNITKYRHI